MLKYNKYLKKIGVKKNDYPFNCRKDHLKKGKPFCASDFYSYDVVLCMQLVSDLSYFKEHGATIGCPAEFVGENGDPDVGSKLWQAVIQKMIDGFAIGATISMEDRTKEQQDKLDTSFNLLKKYLADLWW